MMVTLGCMRILISRGLVLLVLAVLLLATPLLSGGPAFADAAVAKPEVQTPATPPKATYDETQPGAEDPRVKEGFAAYQAGDFKKAYAIWLSLAEAGNAEAQFRIGRLYNLGEIGSGRNEEKAVEWYGKAKMNGHVIAQFNLGTLYSSSKVVPINYNLAVTLLLPLAELGYSPAQHNLGILYLGGRGVGKDISTGLMWIMLAAQNDADSKHFLSTLRSMLPAQEFVSANQKMRDWLKHQSRNK